MGEKEVRQDSFDAPPSQPVTKKSRLGAVGLIFVCGAALFSDGYVLPSRFSLTPTPTTLASPSSNHAFSSLVFAGTVFGMLLFGFLVDRIG